MSGGQGRCQMIFDVVGVLLGICILVGFIAVIMFLGILFVEWVNEKFDQE